MRAAGTRRRALVSYVVVVVPAFSALSKPLPTNANAWEHYATFCNISKENYIFTDLFIFFSFSDISFRLRFAPLFGRNFGELNNLFVYVVWQIKYQISARI